MNRGAILLLGACLLAGAGGRGVAAPAWEPHPGGRSAAVAPGPAGSPGFTLLAPAETGLRFTNGLSAERHLTNQIYLNGSGVAAGDVDGDGWVDLYFCGLEGGSALYRNLGGWRFEDGTAAAGVGLPGVAATGAALADLDGDGDLDLAVNSVGGGTHLLGNDGRGRFTRLGPPLNPLRGAMSMALGDMDGDGDLDLYVANYRPVTIRDQPNTRFTFSTTTAVPQVTRIDGRPLTEPDLTNRFVFRISGQGGRGSFAYDELGEPDELYRNEGGGRFTAVSWTDGTFLDEAGRPLAARPFEWGLAAAFRDLNGDGAPDLYVCNDFAGPDRFWLNDGRGRFRAAPALALRQSSLSAMGVDFADVNRDGAVDFFVVDMLSPDHRRRFTQRPDMRPEPHPVGGIENRPQYPRNMLYVNRGDGTWAELAQLAGLEATDWSWNPVFLDVDLDGWEDLLVSNGFERDNMNMDAVQRLDQVKKAQPGLSSVEQLRLRRLFPRLDTPNLAYRNRGNLRFEEVSAAWGFHDRLISQGMCLADLDNDGDLDVALNNLNAPAGVYRNNAAAPRVAVRLKGLGPNTRGIGARVELRGGPVAQSQEIMAGGRYLSSDDPVRVFAAGPGAGELTLAVTWRSGRRSVVPGVRANRIYEVDEAAAGPAGAAAEAAEPAPWFTDASARVGHVHAEEPHDDFARQPTLPHRVSQLGPGVTWADVDADGWDDLLVASGRGGGLAVLRNDGRGGFSPWAGPFGAVASRDQTTVLAWRQGVGAPLLLVGQASDELEQDGPCVRAWPLAGAPLPDVFPALGASVGPLAMADVDGDGQLDLLAGGRLVPGRWPESAPSALFRGGADGFTVDDEATRVLAGAGLVSGAVFSDLDADGDPDLVLACEWGPLRVWRNERGRWVGWEPQVRWGGREWAGFPHGLWAGVTAADLDGDGRMDLVAANWGRNSRYERFRAGGLRLHYGAFTGPGVVHAIEAYAEPGTGRWLPLQPFQVVGLALPEVRARLGTFEAYATASLPEIYGPAWAGAAVRRAEWLESAVFLNRGDHFEARVLPDEAQWAPAFGVVAADFDGDGAEDVFLAQNCFGLAAEASRADAGRGLLLRGDGRGGFRALGARESGVRVDGEGRGAAAADYDRDGRMDLAVAQNGAATRLYRNAAARPGLRVRLAGPPGNPAGVGAVLRWRSGAAAAWGPARELHAGAGYWSVDSPVTVLGQGGAAGELQVRWPGGRAVTHAVPAGVRSVEAAVGGELKVER